MREVLTSSSGAERRRAALEFLAARPVGAATLVVGDSLVAARGLVHEAAAQRGASFGWEATTLSLLGARLAIHELARLGVAPISGAAEVAMVGRVLGGLAEADELGEFTSAWGQPGLTSAVAKAVRELRLGLVDDASLVQSSPVVAEVLRRYAAALSEHSLVDRADVLSLARKSVHAGAHWFDGAAILLFDVRVATRGEAELAKTLAGSHHSLATFPAGDAKAAIAWVAEHQDRPGATSALERAQASLFRDAPLAGLDDSVRVMSAPSEATEATEIVRSVASLAGESTRFERIAVVVHTPALYRSPLEEAFGRAEIPSFFASGVERPDPMGRAFLCLLDCADEGLSARAFAEYLSLSPLPRTRSGEPRFVLPDDFRATEPGEQSDCDVSEELESIRLPRLWERLIVDSAVIGGLNRWRRRLAGLRNETQLRLTRLLEDDDESGDALERRIAAIDDLVSFALPILERLDALPAAGTWGEWLPHLASLAERALGRPERTLAALKDLEPLGSVGPVDLFDVRQALAERLGELTERPVSSPAGGVFIGTPNDVRGQSFEHVFVCGLAEKLFPKKIVADAVLSDDVREQLGITTSAERTLLERLSLHLAVGCASKSVTLSFPRLDGAGSRPRVPSFYGLEVVRAATGALPDYASFATTAAAASAARISWPAPPNAADAIDETEFDLATLRRLFDEDPTKTRGAASYLLSANEILARSIRFRARRWSLRKWTHADGLFRAGENPSEAISNALARFSLAAQSYSATSLQHFSACPYRFYLRTILRLASRQEPAPIEELSALSRGSLIHDIQFHFLSALKNADELPPSPNRIDGPRQALSEIIERVAAQYRDDLAPAIDRVWGDGIRSIEDDLRGWLQRLAESDWLPLHFELAFGLPLEGDRDPQSRSEPIALDSGLLLKGAIDLVEELGDELRAVDHKTGRYYPRRSLRIGGGEVLQPALYALALEKVFPDSTIASGSLSFCTGKGGYATTEVELDDDVRGAVGDLIELLDAALTNAAFVAAPRKGACDYCDYLAVCGPHEEFRTRRKDQREITELVNLRKRP